MTRFQLMVPNQAYDVQKKSDGSQDAHTRLSILSLLVLIKQWLICLFILLNVDGLPWEYGYMALWALCAISGVTG